MITCIHVGTGGLATLEGALDRLGYAHGRAATPDQMTAEGPLLLLATGDYDEACAALKGAGWWRELRQLVADGRPVLGINLGLHLLAEGSEESPRGEGLGMLPGIVRRLGPGVKVPHLGWSQVQERRTRPGIPDLRGGWLYFAHSHALEPTSATVCVADHGRSFSVLEARGRVLGIQAHPEKSGSLGLVFLDKLLASLGETPVQAAMDHFN
jgi:imidazole glycerol phosphate synthase glutamine amidotransferase subunit